jgi:hypothetical protein
VVVEAGARRALSPSGLTIEELVERYIVSRSARWGSGARRDQASLPIRPTLNRSEFVSHVARVTVCARHDLLPLG